MRYFKGSPDALMLALSDNTRGCLLWRAAERGDVDAMVLLTKAPKMRIIAATSEEFLVV